MFVIEVIRKEMRGESEKQKDKREAKEGRGSEMDYMDKDPDSKVTESNENSVAAFKIVPAPIARELHENCTRIAWELSFI